MHRTRNLAVATGAAACLLAGVVIADPNLPEGAGLDFWNLPALQAEIREYEEHSMALDVRDDVLVRRIEYKERVIVALVASQITLAEAVEHFESLHNDQDMIHRVLTIRYPNKIPRERMWYNVLEYAKMVVKDDPRRDLVHSRLDQEFGAAKKSGFRKT
jgi:hypothetical protein